MKLQIQLRTVSRNGQLALPRRFLEALGVTPPAKVEVLQEQRAIVIRKSPATKLSDEAFLDLLNQVRHRNARVTQRQVAESIRHVRRAS